MPSRLRTAFRRKQHCRSNLLSLNSRLPFVLKANCRNDPTGGSEESSTIHRRYIRSEQLTVRCVFDARCIASKRFWNASIRSVDIGTGPADSIAWSFFDMNFLPHSNRFFRRPVLGWLTDHAMFPRTWASICRPTPSKEEMTTIHENTLRALRLQIDGGSHLPRG